MNCWDVLGIAPTADVALVRHAFAEKSRACHPEDDPAGFVALRNAYRVALRQAAALAFAANTAEGVEEAGRQMAEETSGLEQDKAGAAADAETPAARNMSAQPAGWEAAAPIPAAPSLAVPNPAAQGQALLDFDNLGSQIARHEQLLRQHTAALMSRAVALYNTKPGRRTEEEWRAYFAQPLFTRMCRDAAFTNHFLQFFARNRNFKPEVWQKAVLPQLRQWQYLWNATPLWNRFELVCTAPLQAANGRRHPAPNWKGIWIGLAVFVLLMLMIAIIMRFVGPGEQQQARRPASFPFGLAAVANAPSRGFP